MDFVSIAAAATQFVVPYLVKLRETAQESVAKKAGELTVDKAFDGARHVWSVVKDWYRDDHKFIKLSDYLEADPSDEDSQQITTRELAKRLEGDPAKADELKRLLGGENAVNSIIAGQEAEIDGVRQKIKGSGKNLINVGDKAKIKNVAQEININ
jgi:hypothetical protein